MQGREREGDVEGGEALPVANLSDPFLNAVDVPHPGRWTRRVFEGSHQVRAQPGNQEIVPGRRTRTRPVGPVAQ